MDLDVNFLTGDNLLTVQIFRRIIKIQMEKLQLNYRVITYGITYGSA
jgi:hypothetical protein